MTYSVNPGITFSLITAQYPNGYPDYKGGGYVRQSVEINMVPNHTTDFVNADKNAPLGPKLPENTWHHKEDVRTMEEINKIIHARFTHKGGVSIKKSGG
ncbi:HNH endonuclease [Massilia antarctica]|uniref:HNH endonuclease n=1 Tax=Massilia antarctica TaxID=2765360 RepID=A0AA48W9X6_9BURK|nr:HNH endonuclease [Massilia antarctica]QPI47470.1 HNH endonuclease [Massilia antarctica]